MLTLGLMNAYDRGMLVKVKVTQENINEGTRYDGNRCAMTLTFRDAGYNVLCGYNGVYTPNPKIGEQSLAGFSSEIVDFIRAFDLGKPVKPFEFEIELDYGKNTGIID